MFIAALSLLCSAASSAAPLHQGQKGKSEMGNGREHLASGRGRKASGKGNLHPWQVAEACFLGSVQATLEKPSIDFPVETLVVAIPATRKSLQSLIFYFPERSEEDLIKILGLSKQSG